MKNKFKILKNLKSQKGITILALVITIIVLLILAGITIGAITGNNGLIGQAQTAKTNTEREQIREQIDVMVIQSIGKDGKVDKEVLMPKLETLPDGKEIYDTEEEIYIVYPEYTFKIDLDSGDVTIEDVEISKDETPWELAGSGTEENPYLIESIEDLVAFSNSVNEGNIYSSKYVKLTKTLDFKSPLSYNNPKTKVSEKETRIIKEDTNGEEILTFLTKEDGTGFNPIGGQTDKDNQFRGYFEGNNKEIRNIYINRREENCVGLFGDKTNGYIIELGISGEIIGKDNVGAINGGSFGSGLDYEITDCYNNASVRGENKVGGIIGENTYGNINRCYNKGKILGKSLIGGIVGSAWENVFACINYGRIEGESDVGGIIGYGTTSNYTIGECYNIGEIYGENNTGGIAGSVTLETNKILSCYNLASIYGKESVGGIAGKNSASILTCYNIGEINGDSIIGGIVGSLNDFLENCINSGKVKKQGELDAGGIVGRDNTSSNGGKMTNNFYQQGSATAGIGWIYNEDVEGAMPLPESQMPSVISVLMTDTHQVEWNGEMVDIWKEDTNNINNGYPILFWQ